jgi:hypothetical protein
MSDNLSPANANPIVIPAGRPGPDEIVRPYPIYADAIDLLSPIERYCAGPMRPARNWLTHTAAGREILRRERPATLGDVEDLSLEIRDLARAIVDLQEAR